MEESLTGQLIGGYVVGQLIAGGGMGSIYQAFKPGENTPLAIKVMQPGYDESEEFRERFEREATLLRFMQHPNIMPVYASGEQDNMLYMVMPFVRGPSLYQLLKKRKFSPLAAWQILEPVANALDYAHERGILHRDIKPGNMLIESRHARNPHVYLLDFGLSKVLGTHTMSRAGISLGTPDYMSPEQVRARKLDKTSDVYSLAIVTYEMLLGRLPFDGRSPQEIALKHLNNTPPKPTSFRNDFPTQIEAVLLRALAKDSKARYQSAGEFKLAYAKAVQKMNPVTRRVEYWVEKK